LPNTVSPRFGRAAKLVRVSALAGRLGPRRRTRHRLDSDQRYQDAEHHHGNSNDQGLTGHRHRASVPCSSRKCH
jgi:hypothetical protein